MVHELEQVLPAFPSEACLHVAQESQVLLARVRLREEVLEGLSQWQQDLLVVHRLVPAAGGVTLKKQNKNLRPSSLAMFFFAPLTLPTGQRCHSAGSCSPHVAGALKNTAVSSEMGKKMLGK